MGETVDVQPAFFRKLAAAAAAQSLPRFRQRHAAVGNKLEGGFDPVTEADRETERAIRALIAADYPTHGLLGEEHGSENASGEHLWVIDPIDGTRAFISGLPTWGTLVGLVSEGRAAAGMMAQPFTGELFWANASGAFYEGPGGDAPLKTSGIATLAEATLFTTTPALFEGPLRTVYDRLERAVKLARYGTDCYGFAMVAAGHADIAVDAGLQAYDIVALIPIIEKAGGIVSTFDGGRPEHGGDIIAAANAELHERAMEVVRGEWRVASGEWGKI